jgi:hypothetical protein
LERVSLQRGWPALTLYAVGTYKRLLSMEDPELSFGAYS